MRQIPLRAKGSFSLLVQPEHLANRFKDAILPTVFATPVMIIVMENAALNAIRAYLDPGESAVGTAVNVRHLAATPVGRLVTREAHDDALLFGAIGCRRQHPSAGSKTDARACGDRLGNNARLRSHALRPCRATPRRAGRVVDPDVSDGRAGEDWANCRVPQAVPPKKAANPAVLCTHP